MTRVSLVAAPSGLRCLKHTNPRRGAPRWNIFARNRPPPHNPHLTLPPAQKTDSSHGRARSAQPPDYLLAHAHVEKRERRKTCTRVHRLSCSSRAVSGKRLFNHFVRSFAWQIRLRLFPLPLPSLTYICTHVCVCARVCAAQESVVGDDGEQSGDRPIVRAWLTDRLHR